jgi:hypothetical protein
VGFSTSPLEEVAVTTLYQSSSLSLHFQRLTQSASRPPESFLSFLLGTVLRLETSPSLRGRFAKLVTNFPLKGGDFDRNSRFELPLIGAG